LLALAFIPFLDHDLLGRHLLSPCLGLALDVDGPIFFFLFLLLFGLDLLTSLIDHIFLFDVLLGVEVFEHGKLLEYGLDVSLLFITVQERDCHFVDVVF
jgi:hypothetical protein